MSLLPSDPPPGAPHLFDGDYVLEPLDGSSPEDSDPVVQDARGRLWRVRRSRRGPAWTSTGALAAAFVLLAVVWLIVAAGTGAPLL